MTIECGEQQTNQAETVDRFTVSIDGSIIGVVLRHRYGDQWGDWKLGSNIKHRLANRNIDVEGFEAMIRDCEDYEEASAKIFYLLAMYWEPDK